MKEEKSNFDFEDAIGQIENSRSQIERDLHLGHQLFNEVMLERKIKKVVMVSAPIAALLMLALWVFGPSFIGFEPEQLYDKYYEKHYAAMGVRSDELQDQLTNAIVLYENGALNQALALLDDDVRKLKPDVAEFYAGLILIEQENFGQAEIVLSKIKNRKELLQPELYWYLGLLHFKSGEYDKVKSDLVRMKELDSSYKKKSRRKLLRRIRFH